MKYLSLPNADHATQWRLDGATRAIALLIFAFMTATVSGQEPFAVANLPAQPIGKGDLLSVDVYNAPELSRTIRVSDTGEIRLPMMKRAVRADSLLPDQVAVALRTELESEHLLVRPVVTVSVAEYRSRAVIVTGAVRKPITIQQLGPLTLAEVIARAEGVLPDAADEIVILRAADPAQPRAERKLERIAMGRSVDGALAMPEVSIHSGDEVRVPVAEKIFVVGSVRKPGAYSTGRSESTVLSLLAVSEGLLPFAMKTAYVYRKGPSGRVEVPVELALILSRKAPDVPLEPGDLLYVPDNKTRRLTLTAVDRIVSFGASTTSGLLIWGR